MRAYCKSVSVKQILNLFAFVSILWTQSFAATGILSSQIGYDRGNIKRALIRSSDSTYLPAGTTFEVQTKTSSVVSSGAIVMWGKRWNQFWWSADFTSFDTPGTYKLVVKNGNTVVAVGDTFQIADSLLWKKT